MPSPLRICPELLNRSALSCAECSMVCWRSAFSQVYLPFHLLDNLKSIKNIVATVGKHPLQWAITFSVAFFHYVIGLTSWINDEHSSWTRLTSLYDSCLPFHSTSTAQVAQALLHLLGLFWLSLIVQCKVQKCGLDAVLWEFCRFQCWDSWIQEHQLHGLGRGRSGQGISTLLSLQLPPCFCLDLWWTFPACGCKQLCQSCLFGASWHHE